MRDEDDILGIFSELRRETLYIWIRRGWLSPTRHEDRYRFEEIDVARLRLILEFRSDLELDDEALDVVLPLLDQVHGLRRELHRLAEAVKAQPPAVRAQISALLAKR